jgi:hypothetical protein
MANDSGLNTNEVKEAKKDAAGTEEERYLDRVLEDRGQRKAVVSSHEIVLGNEDEYDDRTVEQQKDLAIGRPHEPVAYEDLNLRGTDVPSDDTPPAKSSAKK